jgi:hypothetical protein
MAALKSGFLYVLLVLLMGLDYFILSDLFTVMFQNSDAGAVTTVASACFLFFIDVVPIFSVTPNAVKLIQGIVSKENDYAEFQSKVISLIGGLILFFASVVTFFIMSVSNPGRLEIIASADQEGFLNITDSITNFATQTVHMNTTLLSVILGILPLFSTAAACIVKFADIGDGEINAAIKKCKDQIKYKEEEITSKENDMIRLEKANTLLDNLIVNVGTIKRRIQVYLNTGEAAALASAKASESGVHSKNDTELRALVIQRFREARDNGDALFARAHMQRSDERQNWWDFITSSENKITKKISK